MKDDFPSNMTAPDLLGLPSFVQARSHAPDGLSPIRDYWAPERTGNCSQDYCRGIQYFAEARDFAHAIGKPAFLAFVVNGMIGRPVGEIEMGFLDALASKAICGQHPAPIPAEEIEPLMMGCNISLDDIARGESEAHLSIDAARFCGTAEIVRNDVIGVIDQTMGGLSVTFLWTISRAAYCGGAN